MQETDVRGNVEPMSDYKRFDINEMARLLETRKMNNHPTVLLLGTRAGGLFRSAHFYGSLHQFSNRDFYKLSRAEQFGECYFILTKYLFSEIDIHNILSASLKNLTVTVADTCLAKLVGQGYFDEVISVNIDGMLEDAFKQAEMKEELEFEVCLAGLDTPRYEKSSPCRIIKTFGDLASRSYAIKGRLSYLESNQELKSVLQRILARDLLVVGIDPVWDEEILRVIPREGGKLWFVNEDGNLIEHSLISAILRVRQAAFIVGGE